MKSLLLAILFLGLGLFIGQAFVPTKDTSDQHTTSTYDRVMRTQTIRCGYVSTPPFLIIDPQTKTFSGIAYEAVEAIGKALNLKIEWAEEVGWGAFPVALKSGRIDMMCNGAWPSAARAREMDHTLPLSYQGYYAFVRADDHRFDDNLYAINDPSVTISTIDGDTSLIIAKADFPKAKLLSLPDSSQAEQLFSTVAAGKSDVTFVDYAFFAGYDKSNPHQLRITNTGHSLRVFGNVFFVAQKQDQFRRMIDAALEEIQSSGQIEAIIKKYEPSPGAILRVAPNYISSFKN